MDLKKTRSQVFCPVVKHQTRLVNVTEPSPLGFQQCFKSMEPLRKLCLGSSFLKVECLINTDTVWSEFVTLHKIDQALAKVSSGHGIGEPFY